MSSNVFFICGQTLLSIMQVPQGNLYIQYSGLNLEQLASPVALLDN
jgi:hypothetical protein